MAVIAVHAQRETVRRFYTFAGYANAVGMYNLKGIPVPDDLSEIENAYDHWDGAYATLPEAPYYLHPIYRPPTGQVGGPFLLFIETRMPDSHLPYTMVIWANADGSNTRVENVLNWNLSELIQLDDARRQASKQPTSSRSSP